MHQVADVSPDRRPHVVHTRAVGRMA